MKFRETSLLQDSEFVIEGYQHIDNGGHTVAVDKYGSVYVKTGNHGYSESSIMMAALDIDGLIDILQKAKMRLNEIRIIETLRGN